MDRPDGGTGEGRAAGPVSRPALTGPYLLEWVALASLVALAAFLLLGPVVVPVWHLFLHLVRLVLTVTLLSVGIAWIVERVRRRTGHDTGDGGGISWLDVLRIVAGFSIVETAHLLLKVFLPVFRKTTFDPLLDGLDRALLGGKAAIELLQGLAKHVAILHGLDLLYSSLYFVLLWGSAVAFLAVLGRRERLAFLGSFALFWQLGLLLYLAVLSWGPVFVRPELFGPLLQHMPVTVGVQRQLVRETAAVVSGRYDIAIRFYGLAAFPSLHVGVMVFYALWGWRVSRRWGVFYLALLAPFVLGSLVTGYHYLVDAPGGAAVALVAFGAGLSALGRRLRPGEEAGPASAGRLREADFS